MGGGCYGSTMSERWLRESVKKTDIRGNPARQWRVRRGQDLHSAHVSERVLAPWTAGLCGPNSQMPHRRAVTPLSSVCSCVTEEA
jgi:hypothetical protein